MAINIRCQKCTADIKLSAKKCSKCGTPVPKNKKYRVIVRVNGKRVTKTVNNLELAREIEGKLKVDNARGDFDIKKRGPAISLKEFWDKKYLPWLKENKKSWYVDECNFKKHIGPALGKKALDTISQFDIEKMVLGLKKKKNKLGAPLSPTTIKHQLVLLTRILNIALKWNMYTGANPCRLVEKPNLNNTVVAFLSKSELESLTSVLQEWPDRMQASIIGFAVFTGVRRSEIFKLEWRDIDQERQTMTLRDPKGKQDATLPLSPQAMEVLENVPKEYDTPFIFYSFKGRQRKTIRNGWKQIKEPEFFRFHDLRHNYASYLVSNGASLYAVQALLTHKDAKTTQKYAHLDDSALRQAVNLSGKVLTTEPKNGDVITLKGRENGK